MLYVAIELNDRLEALVRKLSAAGLLTEEQKYCLNQELEQSHVSVQSLRILRSLKVNDKESLVDCLKGSKLIFPTFAKKNGDQTFVPTEAGQRRELLQRKSEEREYNRMVHGIDSSQDKTSGLGVGKSMAAVQTQVSIMLNMVVATLTAYGIGYYFAGYFTPSTSHRMVAGLGISILVMIIEMILYVLRATQMKC